MEIEQRTLLRLFKDFTATHTVTSAAENGKLSRPGAWKLLRRLESKGFITLKKIGQGKTSAVIARINMNNPLTEKSLALSLTEEAMQQRRWRATFVEMEGHARFLILYGSILHAPGQAGDIDLIGIVEDKKSFDTLRKLSGKSQKTLMKTVHALFFTEEEFGQELAQQNKALTDAVRKGVILFGQENFVKFMKRAHEGWIHSTT